MNESLTELTNDELKAVQEISSVFTKQLNTTSDITQFFDVYFVRDFAKRFVKEKKREISTKRNLINPKRLIFSSRLYFSADLLSKATAIDWKRLYISNFNFKHFESSHRLNEAAEYYARNEKPDFDKITLDYKFYPKDVIKLFENHPNLKGFIHSKIESESIRTIKELKSVNDTLEFGLKLIKEKRNGTFLVKISENRGKIRSKVGIRSFFGAKVEITQTEFWGFPKETRYVSVWIPPGFKLFIFKVENEFKIILNPFP